MNSVNAMTSISRCIIVLGSMVALGAPSVARARVPEEVRANALEVGRQLPDLSALDADKRARLSVEEKRPLVLVFYRGHF